MELSFRDWGNSSKAKGTWVFLHGMGGTGSLWRPIAAMLEDQYRVIAPDQRGHGESQIPFAAGARITPQFTPLDYGQDVVETLEKLKVTSCWIVGHSMGVRTAAAVAHLRPALVRGLVLVDLGFSGEAGGGLGQTLGDFVRKLPSTFANRNEARAFMDQNCPDPSIAQYLLAVATLGSSNGSITFPFDHSALIQTIQAAKDSSVRKWIKETAKRNTSVLVLRGAASKVWSHAEFETEKDHFALSKSIVFEEVSGAGHGLPFEKRHDFVQRIIRWSELSC